MQRKPKPTIKIDKEDAKTLDRAQSIALAAAKAIVCAEDARFANVAYAKPRCHRS